MLHEGPQPPRPADFAESAAQSGGYELAAAKTALAQSRNAQVRAFAERMITEHAQMSEWLRTAAQAAGLPAPEPHVGGDQTRFLASLQSLRDDPFDREYFRQQVLAHTSALAVMRSYAAKGSDANLRRFANAATPMIEQHLQMALRLAQAAK